MGEARSDFHTGQIVEHPKRLEWGPGKILAVEGSKLTVYFRDVPERKHGDAVKTIETALAPLRLAPEQVDPLLDNLPPFADGGFKGSGLRLNLEQGIEEFQRYFPLGFKDPAYMGGRTTGERDYKWAAHSLYVETLGGGRAEKLLKADDIDELRRRVLSVQGRTNLLYPMEAAAFRDGLKDTAAARRYLTAFLELLSAGQPSSESFEPLADAVAALPSEEKMTSPAKWTVVTILPFLAQPSRHMFVKPNPTKACAMRMRFDIQYRSAPNWRTYSKVLEFASVLLEKLRPLGARDMIDAQSFMWVVATYDSSDPR